MRNAADYLAGLFGLKPDAPGPTAPHDPAPAVTAASPGQAHGDGLDLDGFDIDSDGWPMGSMVPQDCPTCPRLLTWQDVGGRWRCERCDAATLACSQRLIDGAARSRQRWPVKTTPQDTPRYESAARPAS